MGHRLFKNLPMFPKNCCAHSSNGDRMNLLMHALNVSAHSVEKLLDVQTVSRCLSRMKKSRAPGADGTEMEHLVYAHPLLVVQLCVMFNVMLQHSVVPKTFHTGIIIPVVKDKTGDLTDITIVQLLLVHVFHSYLKCLCLNYMAICY